MEALRRSQKAYYAPMEGPPMLLSPARRERKKRKREKVVKNMTKLSHLSGVAGLSQSSDPNAACRLPEGFPKGLVFRSLAAYSLLRTLSRELRLSPFTPQSFLRALYLPYPNRLLGQVHASLLRILLVNLNMGYHCKSNGNNIPGMVVKKRRLDGVKWPLVAGDNLTFLDRFTWPLFYDDYVHLTADILWASLNDDENHVNFQNIGMPDTAGMPADCESDATESEDEEEIMAKTAKISETSTLMHSNRRVKKPSRLYYEPNSDDDSYFDQAIDDDEDFDVRPKKKVSTKTAKAFLASGQKLTYPTMASLSSRSPIAPSSYERTGSRGPLRTPNARQLKSLPTHQSSQLHSPSSGHGSPTKRQLPVGRARKGSLPLQKASLSKRTPVSLSTLNWTPPTKKSKQHLSGSKVEWVEGPDQAWNNKTLLGEHGDSATKTGDNPCDITPRVPLPGQTPCSSRTLINPNMLFNYFQPCQSRTRGNEPIASHQFGKKKTIVSDISKAPAESGKALHLSLISELKDKGSKNSTPSLIHSAPTAFLLTCGTGQLTPAHDQPTFSSVRSDSFPPESGNAPLSAANDEKSENASFDSDFNTEKADKIAACTNVFFDDCAKGTTKTHAVTPRSSNGTSASCETGNGRPNIDGLPIVTESRTTGHIATEINGAARVDAKAMNQTAHQNNGIGNTGVSQMIVSEPCEVALIISTGDELAENSGTGFKVYQDKILPDNTDAQSATSEDVSETTAYADHVKQWPHFRPAQTMRAGVPYHRLPVDEKVTALEFLIDELLTVPAIASEFSRRSVSSLMKAPYGALPSLLEFEHLDNDDECALCLGEGELLCCDGCVGSYHRSCIGMKLHEVLPDGRWLCPECEVVDSSKYGTMRGGCKDSIDWFSVGDISDSLRVGNGIHFGQGASSSFFTGSDCSRWGREDNMSKMTKSWAKPPGDATLSLNIASRLPSSETTDPGTSNVKAVPNVSNRMAIASLGPASSCSTSQVSERSLNSRDAFEQSDRAIAMEYIVVHGFILTRPRAEGLKERSPLTGLGGQVDLLQDATLQEILANAGSGLRLAWPFVQIPFSASCDKSPATERSAFHPKLLSFDTRDSYDPSSYVNKYRKAPLLKTVFPPTGFQSIHLVLSDYEVTCHSCNVKKVSDRLSSSMIGDMSLVQSLRCDDILFDPYQMVRDYMLKLELTLNRSHLLDERWGTRSKSLVTNCWQMNVGKCKSVPRLAELLLRLVDACHQRAFLANWFARAGSKETDTVDAPEEKESKLSFLPIASDWSVNAEKRKRRWERCLLSNVRTILAEEGLDVETWVFGEDNEPVRDGNLNRRKRKKLNNNCPTPLNAIYSPMGKAGHEHGMSPAGDDGAVIASQANIVKTASTAICKAENSKKKRGDNEVHIVLPFQELQRAIDRRVTKGIADESRVTTNAQNDSAEGEDAKQAPVSRRSRRSGRLQTKKESAEDFLATVIDMSGKSHDALSMETVIEAQKMAKLVEIKELFSVPSLPAGHWPVAGRLLYDPIGSLSAADMRRLGRNAGTVMAQNVNYSGSYEVGEVSRCHVWRKRCSRCDSFEQLLLLIRGLESYLNKSDICSAEALARRTPSARSQVPRVVCCTQKDLLTGVDQHFILQRNKNRGVWVSALTAELSTLMAARSERREKQQNLFSQKLRERAMVEARSREAARAQAAASAAARAQIMIQEQAAARAKAAKEQADARAKVSREKAAAKALKDQAKAKKAAEKARAKADRDAEREAARQTAVSDNAGMQAVAADHAAIVLTRNLPVVQQATNKDNYFHASVAQVLDAHTMETRDLIRKSSNAGLQIVPAEKVNALRMKTASQLHALYQGAQVQADILTAQLSKAERKALAAERGAKRPAAVQRVQEPLTSAASTANRARQCQPQSPAQELTSTLHAQRQAERSSQPPSVSVSANDRRDMFHSQSRAESRLTSSSSTQPSAWGRQPFVHQHSNRTSRTSADVYSAQAQTLANSSHVFSKTDYDRRTAGLNSWLPMPNHLDANNTTYSGASQFHAHRSIFYPAIGKRQRPRAHDEYSGKLDALQSAAGLTSSSGGSARNSISQTPQDILSSMRPANQGAGTNSNFVGASRGVRNNSSQICLDHPSFLANGSRQQSERGHVGGLAGMSSQQAASLANSFRAVVGGPGYTTIRGLANFTGDHSETFSHNVTPGAVSQSINLNACSQHQPAGDNDGAGGQGLSPPPIFDLEPTPIAESGRLRTGQNPHNGYGQSQRSHPQQQQANQQYQWFQR